MNNDQRPTQPKKRPRILGTMILTGLALIILAVGVLGAVFAIVFGGSLLHVLAGGG